MGGFPVSIGEGGLPHVLHECPVTRPHSAAIPSIIDPAAGHVRQLNEFDTGTGSVYIALKVRDISAKGSAMILYADLGAERSPPALRLWKQGLKTTHRWSKAPGFVVFKPVHHRHIRLRASRATRVRWGQSTLGGLSELLKN